MPRSLDAGTPRSAPASLLDAISALETALERRLLYPDAHPIVGASREAYARAWAATVAELGTTQVSIGPDRMGWGEGAGHELPGPRVGTLARLLHSLHMTAFTVTAEARDEDLLALLDLIHDVRSDPRPFQAIQRWTKESGVHAVHVAALDMDDVRYTDRRADAPSGDASAGLQRYLTGPGEDPTRIAQELMEAWRGREALGLTAVRTELLQRVERVNPGEERELSDRIMRLLAAFPEAVRADLLRIHTPEGSSMFARLLRPLPPRDALTTLLELGQLKGALPRGTTAILTQILHCLPDGDAVADDITARGDDVDAGTVAAALESMFANRADTEYNPEDYQQRLDELARQESLEGSGPSARSLALEDAAGLAVAVGGIACLTLTEAPADEERPLLERVDRTLPALLDRRRTDLVAVAARALRSRAADTSPAGQAFVAQVLGGLDKLLTSGAASPEARDDVRAILALLPPEKVAHEAMRQLLAGGSEADADLLRALLLDVDGKLLARLLTETVEKTPQRIARVRAVLRDGKSTEVHDLLDRLQSHADRRIRTTALAVLVERDGASDHLDALTAALAGPDLELARWALQCLASSSENAEDVTGFLGWMLEKPRSLSADISGRIAGLLLQRGDAGIRRAAAALTVLGRSPQPANARLARRLAASLARHTGDVDVQRALGRWRRSPARWLGWIAEAFSGSRR